MSVWPRYLLALALLTPVLPGWAVTPAIQVAQAGAVDPFVQSATDDFVKRLDAIDRYAADHDDDRRFEATQLLEAFVKREGAKLAQHPDFPALTRRFWAHRLVLFPFYLEVAAEHAKAGRQGGATQQRRRAQEIIDGYRDWDGHIAATLADLEAQLARAATAGSTAPTADAGKPVAATKPGAPAKPGATGKPAAPNRTAAADGSVDAETASRTLPPNYYRGRDMAALTTQIKRAWLQVYPRDTILAVRFPEDNWEDRSHRDFNAAIGQWQHYNHARMRAVVVIKETSKLAVFYTITMVKKPGRGVEVQVDRNEKEQDPDPYRMLISNIRP